jgi:DNA-sulfur modification-associated
MTMPRIQGTGVPTRVMKFKDKAAVGVTTFEVIGAILPDPNIEENPKAMQYQQRAVVAHAELRNEVQRFLKGSAKARNVQRYAEYIASGLRGDYGDAWSTPPLCLWSPKPLKFTNEDEGVALLPLGFQLVAVDGETQVAAIFLLMNDPVRFGLGDVDFGQVLIPYEIFWDIAQVDARQIFHDRNLEGIPVSKNLALGMDKRDIATIIAEKAAQWTTVKGDDGKDTGFTKLVNRRKRQLAGSDPEWVTLSAFRSLVVTTLLGSPGIEQTSKSLTEKDLPKGVSLEQAEKEIGTLLGALVREFRGEFASRSALTAPAVMAGVGALAHHTVSWGVVSPAMTRKEFLAVLKQVRWEREPKYWETVAAKMTWAGNLSFAGGVKDSAGRVYQALREETSPLGMRIRGR